MRIWGLICVKSASVSLFDVGRCASLSSFVIFEAPYINSLTLFLTCLYL